MSEDLTLVSAATVARLKDGSILRVRSPYIVTPSAAELAARKNVRIELREGEAEAVLPAPVETALLASFIDSTLLTAVAVPEQIAALCAEAAELHCAAVCVNPIYVAQARDGLSGTGVAVCTVCGFPLGASAPSIKAAHARWAVEQGASEIDMVIPVGLLKAGDLGAVSHHIAAVREVLAADHTLKVIIEAPLLADEEKIAAAVVAVDSGADYVKTGTGFAGPATASDVQLLSRVVGDRARIKAAGGIRDRQTAESLIAAGAGRIGTSSAASLLQRTKPDE